MTLHKFNVGSNSYTFVCESADTRHGFKHTCTLFEGDSRQSFYGKAVVVEDADGATLLSYCTPVCRLNNDGTFSRLWSGYSATTMRHINSFIRFFNLSGGGKSWWDALPAEE